MAESVHFIPVGFDFERLIYPISKGQMEADRVILVTHESSEGKAAQLGSQMTSRLEESFQLIDVEVERRRVQVETLFEYGELYPMAYRSILGEIEKGNTVHINISSMPRTIAFSFATAANTLITEYEEEIEGLRNRLYTYYVPPEEYLVLEMIETLESVVEIFGKLNNEDSIEINQQYREVQSLLDRVNRGGVTAGAAETEGKRHIEIPHSPRSDVSEFEEVILHFLSEVGMVRSTSDLAEMLADHLDESYSGSYRSRVQYNVSNLDKKGYLTRHKDGNRLKTELSKIGEMWVKTHD